MYRLSSIILILLSFVQGYAQSPHGDKLKIDCALCHNASGWIPLKDKLDFNHNDTSFPLEGNHAQTDCKQCHASLEFGVVPKQCIGCHTDLHSQSLGNDCARCHSPKSWIVDNIPELHEQSGFPLSGSHGSPTCVDCHTSETNLRFDRIGNDCINCHRDDYTTTTRPNHEKAGYSLSCTECHDIFSPGWSAQLTNHDFFPLVKGHDIQDCARCHIDGNFATTSPDCVSCHQDDFSATKNPNHTSAQFSNNCAECHTIDGWNPSLFDHDPIYLLKDAHAVIANNCNQCHSNGYVNTPNTCIGCHLPDYNATADPNHSTSKFPTDCVQCHSEVVWSPSTFDHNSFYPLQGAHASIANNCLECHSNGYVNTPNTCVGCHLTDFNSTKEPNHTNAQFTKDCIQCHNETAWSPTTFDHNTVYPLHDAHAAIANNCNQCHANGYVNTPNTCVGCHLPDYNSTSNPNHGTNQFPKDCIQCHSEVSWSPSTFDHNTVYPLHDAHAAIANNCNQCHANGYVNTPNTCVGCHQADYNATTDPNHISAQFSTDCKVCHGEVTWIPSSFNHNTIYPLVGAHAIIANNCNQCHAAGYVNTPNTCVGCHLTDYNTTNSPNHSSAHFPTTCVDCHNETAWIPSSYDHDGTYFPIYSGKHREAWNSCTDCHTNNSDYGVFSCIDCHRHSNKLEVDNDHKEFRDYVYTSAACYSCHPNGTK